MDTSNSTDMNFVVAELRASDLPEERELAVDATRTIYSLVEEIKPVLRYVTNTGLYFLKRSEHECVVTDRSYKIAAIYKPSKYPRALFIEHDGQFMFAEPCSSGGRHWHRIDVASDEAWPQISFATVVEGLQRLLKEAEEKRKEHLKRISARRQKLDEIVAILER